MRKLDLNWMSYDAWLQYIDGDLVLMNGAPREAQESYKRYLQQTGKPEEHKTV